MRKRIAELWRKLLWTWAPASQREAGEAIVRNLWLHWFPAKVARKSLSWNYSFWLGTVTAVLFLILNVTGLLLMFFYVPSTERAYGSIKDLDFAVSFGRLLRNQHRWAAHAMVASAFLHMVRVFFTGAYRGPRAWNWLVGLGLLLSTMLTSFTGYLLPWDQLAYWAVTVGTNIAREAPVVGDSIRFVLLGGTAINQNALLRFYVLHVFFLPAVIWVLFAYHMWRVRKDGGLAVVERVRAQRALQPKELSKSKSYSLFNLTLLLAIFFNAPLEEAANPAVTPNPAKAPWYFLWLQELVASTTVPLGPIRISGGLVGGILVPGFLLALAAIWPFADRSPRRTEGAWFPHERRTQNAVFAILVAAIVVLMGIGLLVRGPYWRLYWPGTPWPQMPHQF